MNEKERSIILSGTRTVAAILIFIPLIVCIHLRNWISDAIWRWSDSRMAESYTERSER